MGAHCCDDTCPDTATSAPTDRGYRRVLWTALLANAGMFVAELVAGAAANSASLWADSADFLADAANYVISLFVLDAALVQRARAALAKGLSLGAMGLLVAGATAWNAWTGTVPEANLMGAVGALALATNLGVAALLFAYRRGDANMRSVWICSRNDALANVAVLAAAAGVFGTRTGWPDILVAAIMAALALWGATQIVRQALGELHAEGAPPAAE